MFSLVLKEWMPTNVDGCYPISTSKYAISEHVKYKCFTVLAERFIVFIVILGQTPFHPRSHDYHGYR